MKRPNYTGKTEHDEVLMTHFLQRTGTKSAFHQQIEPFPDVAVFNAIIRSLILKNPLGCTSYKNAKKTHLPIKKVRELYTAKFEYQDMKGKWIRSGSDVYDSVD